MFNNNFVGAVISFRHLNKNQIAGIEPIDFSTNKCDYDIEINPNDDDETIINCWCDNVNDYDLPSNLHGEWCGGEFQIIDDNGEAVEVYYDFEIRRYND